ncbi:MAG: GNAT family N-acetyltransferase [Micropepsaceae bacterium]
MSEKPVHGICLIRENKDAFELIGAEDVTRLTRAATGATFYRDDMTEEQIAANLRIVDISAATVFAACEGEQQNFAAAFVDGVFAGYVIATRHPDSSLELDWLMVHPDYHGSDVSKSLMRIGIAWLGEQNEMWLNVIRHNERAIRFYRRFGFEIDPVARTSHVVPHVVMRRVAAVFSDGRSGAS